MIKTKGLTGSKALLRVLTGMGVERIFASPGSEWAPVWEDLAKKDPDEEHKLLYLSSRHEETAVGMATGYAKASGKLPAVMLHTTVGSLHGAMALRGALHEQIPMVVLAGESIDFGESEGPDPGKQWLRHLADIGGPVRLVKNCVKWSVGMSSSTLIPATIQRACQLAISSPRGPVFVGLPMEFLFHKMSTDAPASTIFPPPPTPAHRGLEELAENPMIITEAAGENITSVQRLVELAELLGAAVVETRSCTYINFPRSHPLHGGFQPRELLHEADLILLLATVAPWHPSSAKLNPAAKVVVLDENPLRQELPFWGFPVDLVLTGEVESSLELLLDHLKERIPSDDPPRVARVQRWQQRHQERKQLWTKEALALKEEKPMDTRWVVYKLNEVLPPDSIIVEETITHRLAIHRYLDRLQPGCFFSGFTGGLGTGLGTALGVKIARPDRPVIALIGDGAFNYNPVMADLGFAQEYEIPILIVLFNNQGYLTMKEELPRYFPEGWAMKTGTFLGTSITPSPNYAAIAGAFGGYGEKVEEPGELGPAFERGLAALSRGQVALLDIWLNPVN
jgi:acetolactate synthase-1/2/3 large subunit